MKGKRIVQPITNSSIYLCSPKVFKDTISLPLIEFKRIKESLDLTNYTTLLFTSKQAVVYTNEISDSWKNKKILAVGSATAKIAKELGAIDIYYPKEFYGKELAKDIIDKFNKDKILYIRPKIVAFDSRTFLSKEGIDISEEIIYETNCVEYNNKKLNENAIIIFTSPSTIDCFFKSFKWNSSWRAVVIGKTTLKNLDNNIIAYVADKPRIDSCIKKAYEI